MSSMLLRMLNLYLFIFDSSCGYMTKACYCTKLLHYLMQGQCLLTEAPAQATEEQLKEVHIQRVQEEA